MAFLVLLDDPRLGKFSLSTRPGVPCVAEDTSWGPDSCVELVLRCCRPGFWGPALPLGASAVALLLHACDVVRKGASSAASKAFAAS